MYGAIQFDPYNEGSEAMEGRAQSLLDSASARIKEAIEMAQQAQDEVKRGDGGREIAVGITNAETAILWLQKAAVLVG
jgi:hypothetical protein